MNRHLLKKTLTVGTICICLIFEVLYGLLVRETQYLVFSYQKTGEEFLTVPTHTGAQLELRLTHSFEHVTWNEYYTLLEDDTFRLDRIEVGGYGAGIPAEMDVKQYVGTDGLVHMDEINSIFSEFNWITSQKNMKDFRQDGEILVDYTKLPHHSFVNCKVQRQRRFFYG